MTPSAWARKQGISCTTAWRWFRDGRLRVRAEQMATGTVIVHEEEALAAEVVEEPRQSPVGDVARPGRKDRRRRWSPDFSLGWTGDGAPRRRLTGSMAEVTAESASPVRPRGRAEGEGVY
jgi:hypothetical protein